MIHRFSAIAAAAALVLASYPASAVTVFDDAGAHLISTNLMDSISVSNATTVEVTTGGVTQFFGPATENGATVTGGSNLILSGGTIRGNIGGFGAVVTNSNFVGTSGLIQGSGASGGAHGLVLTNSTFNISGGTYQGGDGGSFPGGAAITMDSNSTGVITGGNFIPGSGSILGITAPILGIAGGMVQISGGNFATGRNIVVGFNGSSSVIDFYGSNFMLNGNTLTGLLADNSVLNVNLFVGNTGTVLFNGAPLSGVAVPEPATAGLALLGFAGLMTRRRATVMVAEHSNRTQGNCQAE